MKKDIMNRLICLLLVLTMVLAPVGSIHAWATEDGEESEVQPLNDDDGEEDGEGAGEEEPQVDPDSELSDDPDENYDNDDDDDYDEDDDDWEEIPAETVHEHDFRFKLNDSKDALTVTCIEDECSIEGSKITVKLTASDKVYDGTAANATLQNEKLFREEVGGSASLQLTKNGGNVSSAVSCGTYSLRAVVKADGEEYELKKEFKISQHPISLTGISVKDKVYDGTTDAELDLSRMSISGKASGDNLTVEVTKATFPTADVGVHTVTLEGLKLSGTSADNYKLDSSVNKVEFVEIRRRDISDAQITLGPSLFYNGKTQTQEIESVELPEEESGHSLELTYSVRGNTAKDEGNYTLTITGTGNFSGSVSKEFRVLPAAGQITGSSMKYGSGKLSLELQENDLGVTLVSGLEDAVKILSAERLAAVAEGDTVAWKLRVDPVEPDAAQRQALSTAAGDKELIGSGLRFTLTETVNGTTETLDTSVFRPKVTVAVPEDVKKNDSASTTLLRCVQGPNGYVSGPAEMTYNAKDGVFTFVAQTDSIYMLATKKASVGGTILVVAMILLMVFSAGGLGFLLYLKFRNRDMDDDDYDDEDFSFINLLKERMGKSKPVGDERATEVLPQVPVEEPPVEEELDFLLDVPVESLYAEDAPIRTVPEEPVQTLEPVLVPVEDDIDLEELEKLLNMKDDELKL